MASSPFTGPMFEILAGSEQVSILAHASILSKSDTLKALVEGSWKDSVERQIKMEDWDADTINRLVEWLYAGKYSSPCPEKASSGDVTAIVGKQTPAEIPYTDQALADAESSSLGSYVVSDSESDLSSDLSSDSDSDSEFESDPDLAELASIFGSSPEKHSASEADHDSRRCIPATPKSPLDFKGWLKRCATPSNTMNFEPSLLAHAKMYCLANYMMLPALRELALKHVAVLLSHVHPIDTGSPAVMNLIVLIRYVYANTCTPGKGEDPLRKYLCCFTANNAAAFRDKAGTEVLGLMMEGGDFTADVWRKTRANLGVSNRKVTFLKSEVKRLKGDLESAFSLGSSIGLKAKFEKAQEAPRERKRKRN